ncbi:MAG: hypothetical protein JSS62_03760 [Verrucomicrobia bacterium]|nr:hypothetical protein [Verrucomicrobiota bacterium]MBS0645114.1 hypothetical protein [Verrucomicrobiota bacterium]
MSHNKVPSDLALTEFSSPLKGFPDLSQPSRFLGSGKDMAAMIMAIVILGCSAGMSIMGLSAHIGALPHALSWVTSTGTAANAAILTISTVAAAALSVKYLRSQRCNQEIQKGDADLPPSHHETEFLNSATLLSRTPSSAEDAMRMAEFVIEDNVQSPMGVEASLYQRALALQHCRLPEGVSTQLVWEYSDDEEEEGSSSELSHPAKGGKLAHYLEVARHPLDAAASLLHQIAGHFHHHDQPRSDSMDMDPWHQKENWLADYHHCFVFRQDLVPNVEDQCKDLTPHSFRILAWNTLETGQGELCGWQLTGIPKEDLDSFYAEQVVIARKTADGTLEYFDVNVRHRLELIFAYMLNSGYTNLTN